MVEREGARVRRFQGQDRPAHMLAQEPGGAETGTFPTSLQHRSFLYQWLFKSGWSLRPDYIKPPEGDQMLGFDQDSFRKKLANTAAAILADILEMYRRTY